MDESIDRLATQPIYPRVQHRSVSAIFITEITLTTEFILARRKVLDSRLHGLQLEPSTWAACPPHRQFHVEPFTEIAESTSNLDRAAISRISTRTRRLRAEHNPSKINSHDSRSDLPSKRDICEKMLEERWQRISVLQNLVVSRHELARNASVTAGCWLMAAWCTQSWLNAPGSKCSPLNITVFLRHRNSDV